MKPDPDDNLLAIVAGIGMIYLLYIIFAAVPVLWKTLVALYALLWIIAIILAVILGLRLCFAKLGLWTSQRQKRPS